YENIFPLLEKEGWREAPGWSVLRLPITRHQIALLIDLVKSLFCRPFTTNNLAPADVLIVSWLVNINHLDMEHDFYFGDLQTRLARRGISSLLVLRNQIGHPTSSLIERAKRTGLSARLMLPD